MCGKKDIFSRQNFVVSYVCFPHDDEDLFFFLTLALLTAEVIGAQVFVCFPHTLIMVQKMDDQNTVVFYHDSCILYYITRETAKT